jgi:hypothetical protein
MVQIADVDYVAVLDEPPADTKCVCGGCGWTGPYSALGVIDSCALTPGDPSPAGRCPDPQCGSLAYVATAGDGAEPQNGNDELKAFGEAFLAACRKLTLEETGAYITIICHICANRCEPIPFSATFFGQAMGCHKNKATALVKRLLAVGVLLETADGRLSIDSVLVDG